MYNIRNISKDFFYLGCSDRRLSLFESAYPVPCGISYNSYLLKDEKTVLFDTVDKACAERFYENLEVALDGRKLNYLVIHHMEPDHAALIKNILNKYPDVEIVCNQKTEAMLKQFFDLKFENLIRIVKEGDCLNTGAHELRFFMAPMVHWPEVMVTYDSKDKILFSADAFGSFGAINGRLFDNDKWLEEELDEARRYYTNIVGKYGLQVQMLLKKIAQLDIKMVCPLHGFVIKNNINLFLEKYNKWSNYEPEENGVLIAYTSVYGNTENAVEILASKLADSGMDNIKMFDLSYTHYSYVLAEAFRYSHVIIATTTYNAGVFESMNRFINVLTGHNLQNRKFVIIENGSWAATCGGQIRTELEKLKGSEFLCDKFSIKSSLKQEQIVELDNIVKAVGVNITSPE